MDVLLLLLHRRRCYWSHANRWWCSVVVDSYEIAFVAVAVVVFVVAGGVVVAIVLCVVVDY